MPRDGSGTYSQPFPPVTEGTTIESTVYNGYTADVSIDLNSPRPISTGGTGANNAADAMSNLGGEGSKIEVLNYDSHNFTAGSFYSKSSATNPPVAGHAFTGICYVAVVSGVATSDMFVEVRDRDEPTQPGSLYVRQKKAGTWSGWQKAAGTTMGATPPATPSDGVLWWDPTRGKLFIFYADPDTSQWVECVATPDMNPDDFIRIDTDQTLTEAQKAQGRENIYAAPFDALAYNGMQINGSLDVSQEKGFGVPVTGSSAYVCDGWHQDWGTLGTLAVDSAVATNVTATGLPNCIYMRATTGQASLTAGEVAGISNRIEGYRVARLGWGTANASPVTIAFWSGHHRIGNYSLALRAAGGTRSYTALYTHNVADVWQYNVITIPGDTTGTWDKTNGMGLIVDFTMACGTTLSAPSANTWFAGNYVAAPGQVNGVAANTDVLRIASLVVLPGIEAPSAARSPLIMRPYDQELLTCQRYYRQWGETPQTFQRFANGMCVSATSAEVLFGFSPTMRAVPAYSMTGPTAVSAANGSLVAVTGISASIILPYSLHLIITTGGGLVAGNATRLLVNNDANTRLKLDARL